MLRPPHAIAPQSSPSTAASRAPGTAGVPPALLRAYTSIQPQGVTLENVPPSIRIRTRNPRRSPATRPHQLPQRILRPSSRPQLHNHQFLPNRKRLPHSHHKLRNPPERSLPHNARNPQRQSRPPSHLPFASRHRKRPVAHRHRPRLLPRNPLHNRLPSRASPKSHPRLPNPRQYRHRTLHQNPKRQ